MGKSHGDYALCVFEGHVCELCHNPESIVSQFGRIALVIGAGPVAFSIGLPGLDLRIGMVLMDTPYRGGTLALRSLKPQNQCVPHYVPHP